MLTGIVFGIQRFSIHDGPGIRTTVFLKGCDANCKWCHNPESISKSPIIGFNTDKCVHCGTCAAVCENKCHVMADGKHVFDRTACVVCGKCVDACPVKALEQIGKNMTIEEVMKVVLRDKKYYEKGGGVTLSGGEALLQKEFSMELLKACHKEGIHCAIETNGVHAFSTYEEVMPFVDLFLLDYKATDPEIHKEYVGCDNKRILENMKRLLQAGAKVLLRCPIIPGVNDNKEHFDTIAALTKEYPELLGAEILPYHNLGVSKAKRIEMRYQEFTMVDPCVSNGWKQYIIEQGGRLVNV